MNHDWQLRRKFATDTVMRCAACGVSRADEFDESKDEWGFEYRRKGHVRWHSEEPSCGPKPVTVKVASKNVSRAAVAEVAAELRKKADEAHADAIAARDASNDNMVAVCGARFVAYATAAEAIERVLK